MILWFIAMNRQSQEINKATNWKLQGYVIKVQQQNWGRRQSSLHMQLFNKEATEHYIVEKVHLYVCTGGNPALYIHYVQKQMPTLHAKVPSLCRRQSSTANVSEPSLVFVRHNSNPFAVSDHCSASLSSYQCSATTPYHHFWEQAELIVEVWCHLT